MQTRSMQIAPARLAAGVLALSLAVTAAYAQPAPKAPAAKPRSNAELQQEIDTLRAQIAELQMAHGMASDKQPGKGMPNRGSKGMPDSGSAMPPAAPPMKKDCMGMGCMKKGDDAMGMPPPDAADSQPMPGAMPHM